MHFVKSNLINIEDDGSKKHLALDRHCTRETKKKYHVTKQIKVHQKGVTKTSH